MSFLDEQFISLVSHRLRNFKKRSNVYVFSCAFCDTPSEHKTPKAYFQQRKGEWYFHCFRCSVSYRFSNFLRLIDPDLYRQYKVEEFLGTDAGREKAARKAAEAHFTDAVAHTPKPAENPLSGAVKLSELPSDHMANRLVAHRRLPPDKFLHVDAFKAWSNDVAPGSFDDLRYDEPRLVIPFFREDRFVGFQGRSYVPDAKIRYITISLDKNDSLVYGMDDLNDTDPVICVEAPIDALCVRNGVASAGGSISASIKYVGLDKDRVIVCYDNEPRSVYTVKKMRQAAKEGYAVCLWPESFYYKDTNEAVIDGMTIDGITDVIVTSSKRGLAADLGITAWRKCDG